MVGCDLKFKRVCTPFAFLPDFCPPPSPPSHSAGSRMLPSSRLLFAAASLLLPLFLSPLLSAERVSAPSPPPPLSSDLVPLYTSLLHATLVPSSDLSSSVPDRLAVLAFPFSHADLSHPFDPFAVPSSACLSVEVSAAPLCFDVPVFFPTFFVIPPLAFVGPVADLLLSEGRHDLRVAVSYSSSSSSSSSSRFPPSSVAPTRDFKLSLYVSHSQSTSYSNLLRDYHHACSTSASHDGASDSDSSSSCLAALFPAGQHDDVTIDPVIFLTSPKAGELSSGRTLTLTYLVAGLPSSSSDHSDHDHEHPSLDSLRLVFTLTNGEIFEQRCPRPFSRGLAKGEITLGGVDPGTHVVSATVVSSFNEETRNNIITRSTAGQSTTVFEQVLTKEEGGNDGYGRRMTKTKTKTITTTTTKGKRTLEGEDDDDDENEQEETGRKRQEGGSTRHLQVGRICDGPCGGDHRDHHQLQTPKQLSRKIKIMFVGMMKLDGQKTIWLHQFRRLDRSKFDLQFTTFQDVANQSDASTMQQALRDAGVALTSRPLPMVSEEEIAATPDLNTDKLFRDSGIINMEALVDCMQARLKLANSVVSNVTPPWVRETWSSILSEISVFGPDILVFANARESTDRLLTTAARLAGVRHIVMELPNLFPSVDLSQIDAIVAPSLFAARHYSVQETIREHVKAGGRAPDVHVIHPGVDVKAFSPEGPMRCLSNLARAKETTSARPPHTAASSSSSSSTTGKCGSPSVVIGLVGRVASEKSPGLFILAAELVSKARPDARFVVIGDGKARRVVEEMAAARGLLEPDAEVMTFTGAKYGDDLTELMRGIDVLVGPSLRYESETFCIANVEAMSMEIPLVTFGIGGVGSYLQHDVNGIVIDDFETPARAVEKLAEEIVKLVDDKAKRERLGSGGGKTSFEFRIDGGFMVKYEQLYESMVVGEVVVHG